MENEHLNNAGKFRAVNPVPLPFDEVDEVDWCLSATITNGIQIDANRWFRGTIVFQRNLIVPFHHQQRSNLILIACGSVEFGDSSYTCIHFFFFFIKKTNEKKIIQNCTVVLILKLVNHCDKNLSCSSPSLFTIYHMILPQYTQFY